MPTRRFVSIRKVPAEIGISRGNFHPTTNKLLKDMYEKVRDEILERLQTARSLKLKQRTLSDSSCASLNDKEEELRKEMKGKTNFFGG